MCAGIPGNNINHSKNISLKNNTDLVRKRRKSQKCNIHPPKKLKYTITILPIGNAAGNIRVAIQTSASCVQRSTVH